MLLRALALGVAVCDVDHGVRETGGNNSGPRVREYLANCTPPINVAAPWCAAAVQYWSDLAARSVGVPNPLDGVKREAYVQDYYDYLRPAGAIPPASAEPGDIVVFSFGGKRWDHIGLVVRPVDGGGTTFVSVEGNTGDENQRDGDVVAIKTRVLSSAYDVAFLRWAT